MTDLPIARYRHTAEELRYVAKVLDALNTDEPDGGQVGFDGELQLCWLDRLMGRIVRLDDDDNCSDWVYEPYATPAYTPSEDE